MLEIIKEVSQNLLEAKQLCDVVVGEVETIAPITIRLNQKILLDEGFLVFSKTVLGLNTDFRLGDIDTSHTHPSASFDAKTAHKHRVEAISADSTEVCIETAHSHASAGEVFELEHRHSTEALMVGDRVIMIRATGGQKYFVIDKVGEL